MAKQFDPNLDNVLFEQEVECTLNSNIIVKVVSYNDGEPKLQLSRKNFSEQWTEPRFAKLGRLSFAELNKIMPVICEGIKTMGNNIKEGD